MSYSPLFSFVSFRRPDDIIVEDSFVAAESPPASPAIDPPPSTAPADQTEQVRADSAFPVLAALGKSSRQLAASGVWQYSAWAGLAMRTNAGETVTLGDLAAANGSIAAEIGAARAWLLRGSPQEKTSSDVARMLRMAALLAKKRELPPALLKACYAGTLRKRPAPSRLTPVASRGMDGTPKPSAFASTMARIAEIKEGRARLRDFRRKLNQATNESSSPPPSSFRLLEGLWPTTQPARVPAEPTFTADDVLAALGPVRVSSERGAGAHGPMRAMPSSPASVVGDEAIRPIVARQDTKQIRSYIQTLDEQLDADQCHEVQQANKLFYQALVGEEPLTAAPDARPSMILPPGLNRAIRVLGPGDLVTVEERLKRYVTGEIAHIENTVKGVRRERDHVLIISNEESVETYQLTENESRRSLETNLRAELSTMATESARETFGIETGAKASGQVGMMNVEATLDVSYQRDRSEASSVAQTTAKEIVSRAEERIKSAQSQLRRTITRRKSRERNTETFSGTDETGSHIYLWLEQERELRLLHKGTRVFVEFFVPEPAVDLRTPVRSNVTVSSPPAFLPSVPDIAEENYLAYATFYRATGIEPPPAEYVKAPFSVRTEPEYGADESDTLDLSVSVPPGYIPERVQFAANGREPTDDAYWFVAVNGQKLVRDYYGPGSNGLVPVVGDGYEFSLDAYPTSVGDKVTVVVAGHHAKCAGLNGILICRRGCDLFSAWQMKTHAALRQAHQSWLEEYERARDASGVSSGLLGGSAAENRQCQIRELKKWCKMLLGVRPPAAQPYSGSPGLAELDPAVASEQSFAAQFFENAFEWREMSYFLLGYDVAPQERWRTILGSTSADPRHTEFLQAGAARDVVPIMPRFELAATQYVNSDTLPTQEQITDWLRPLDDAGIDVSAPNAETANLYLELLVANRPGVVFGSGLLALKNQDRRATLVGSLWSPTHIDVGRKIYVAGEEFRVTAVTAGSITLDREWNGPDAQCAFAVEAIQLGDRWRITLPTPLILHHGGLDDLDVINDHIAMRE